MELVSEYIPATREPLGADRERMPLLNGPFKTEYAEPAYKNPKRCLVLTSVKVPETVVPDIPETDLKPPPE
jgi:hypothetical protein